MTDIDSAVERDPVQAARNFMRSEGFSGGFDCEGLVRAVQSALAASASAADIAGTGMVADELQERLHLRYTAPTKDGTRCHLVEIHLLALAVETLRGAAAAFSHEKARADEAEISDDLAHGEMRSLAAELAAATRELTRLRAIEAAGRAALERIAAIDTGYGTQGFKYICDIAREALAVKPA